HVESNEVGRETWEPFVSSLGPSVLDADISPLVVAELAKALAERFDEGIGRRAGAKDADAGGLPRLLRPGGERRGEEGQGEGGWGCEPSKLHGLLPPSRRGERRRSAATRLDRPDPTAPPSPAPV